MFSISHFAYVYVYKIYLPKVFLSPLNRLPVVTPSRWLIPLLDFGLKSTAILELG